MTNYERIKNMNIDELAAFFDHFEFEVIDVICTDEFCPFFEKDYKNCGISPKNCFQSAAKKWLETEVGQYPEELR